MLERGEREGQQLDNYRLMRLLGTGSFGEVYLGEHIYRQTRVAIKILPQLAQDDLQSFLTEARTMRLNHPHIVRVLDFGVEKRTPFIVMEYVPNGTLRQHHPKGTQVPLPIIILYVKQVASALQYTHDERLVHRDVKPENMLIGAHNEILLSDFGIATFVHGTNSQNLEAMAGTIAYMAPEQIQMNPRPASDQYALAVVVYEWLCGDRPFHGTLTEMAMKHALMDPPPLREKVPTITPDVEHVVMTALAKDPKRRFGSVKAFATALEQASQSQTIDSATRQAVLIPSDEQQEQPTVADASLSRSHSSTFVTYPSSSPPRPVTPAPPLVRSKTAWSPRAKANWRTLLLVGLTLLVIASGVSLFSINHANQAATTAIASNTTDTTAASIAAPTATAQVNATATASLIAANPDPYGAGGTLALYDPLRDNTMGYRWDEGNIGTGGDCKFTRSGYDVLQSEPNSFNDCFANATNFSNFAYEVQMTIIRGDAGGILFRGGSAIVGAFYYFTVSLDGYYEVFFCPPNSNSCNDLVRSTRSPAIKPGLNQVNLLAVVANRSTFTIYVNHHPITSFNDSTFRQGQIGVVASPLGTNGHPTEVVFSNAKVWTF